MSLYRESIRHQKGSKGFRKWAKNQMNRRLRQAGRKNPETTLTKKPKRGYSD